MEYINKLEKEIEELRKALHQKEDELHKIKQDFLSTNNVLNNAENNKLQVHNVQLGDKLPRWAIVRYSRQILLSDIGVAGQQALCISKVLVVGAGALGCPAMVYLAGAGIGEIGIVDYDTVEITNIHRQFLHTENDQNISKVNSAANKLRSINSNIKITPYNVQLSSQNALEIAKNYDIVLDCTDNVPTRYLLNDTCIILKKPLISGSALKMEGQLTIYGYSGNKNSNEIVGVEYHGPCYRCIFPTPPLPETVGSCSANGVAGPVPGAIGALQALEAIKYIIGKTKEQLLVERMLIFDGDDITFRTVKLRPRNPHCAICSDSPTIKQLLDYEQFCNSKAQEKDLDLKILPDTNRMTAVQLSKELSNENWNKCHLLVDVRSEPEFKMCSIDGSVNYPIEKLHGNVFTEFVDKVKSYDRVTLLCRRGNDSQIVTDKLLSKLKKEETDKIKDLIGGLHSWAKNVDENFPIY